MANTESVAFRRFSGGTIAQGEPVVSPDGTKSVFQETRVDYDIVALDLATAKVTPMIATIQRATPAWALDQPLLVIFTTATATRRFGCTSRVQPHRPL